MYNGQGELYFLNRVSESNIPKAKNIINEGIYMGKYKLVLCTTIENLPKFPPLFVVFSRMACIHFMQPLSMVTASTLLFRKTLKPKVFSLPFHHIAFSPEMKWSQASNTLWATQYCMDSIKY